MTRRGFVVGNTIEGIGIVCVIGAVVGGGLKGFGVEIPMLQSWWRQSLLAVFGLILIGSQQPMCLPRVIVGCPNVSGDWQRQADALTAHIDQTCCRITSTQKFSCCDHSLTGSYKSGSFEYTVIRTFLESGCKAELYGKLTLIDRNHIKTEVYGTNGRCRLSM